MATHCALKTVKQTWHVPNGIHGPIGVPALPLVVTQRIRAIDSVRVQIRVRVWIQKSENVTIPHVHSGANGCLRLNVPKHVAVALRFDFATVTLG